MLPVSLRWRVNDSSHCLVQGITVYGSEFFKNILKASQKLLRDNKRKINHECTVYKTAHKEDLGQILFVPQLLTAVSNFLSFFPNLKRSRNEYIKKVEIANHHVSED
jgi:hypothetical protein